MFKPILALTMGDPAGIGPEIIVKALSNESVYERCIPILIGDRAPLAAAQKACGTHLSVHVVQDPAQALGRVGTIDLIEGDVLADQTVAWGCVDARAGEAAFRYVEKSIELARSARVHAVVTAPLNKEAMHMAGHLYPGHTEIFAEYTGTKQYSMLLMSGSLRVVHVTTHVSMRKACDLITVDRVLETIELAHACMTAMGIAQPRIGVAGLNAHSGENGLFGKEEQTVIRPAVARAQAAGICVQGPVSPDAVFVQAMGGAFDIVEAMYHDQGHIPLKLAGFRMDPNTGLFTQVSGVNCTVGLPIIRTSVDHGTAFDKAGQGVANEQSMIEAIDAAILFAAHRFEREK